MPIGYFSISNILLGKGIARPKHRENVVLKQNEIAIGSRCFNCIDNLNRIIINIGKLQISHSQLDCSTFGNRHSIITSNLNRHMRHGDSKGLICGGNCAVPYAIDKTVARACAV